MKTVFGIVVLLVFVGSVYKLNDITRNEKGESILNVAEEVAIKVEVTKPTQRNLIRMVLAPGDVEAISEVDISGEVMAKIIEMPVEEGDPVNKGDLLCRLDDAAYQSRLTSAKANVVKLKATIVQANADFDKAERDYRRQKRLIEQDATSVTELRDSKTIWVRAQALVDIRQQELIEAQARWQTAKEDLLKTVITSPIDGIVSQRFAKPGEIVVTGTMNNPGTRIMVISDMSKMQVRCRVDESDAPRVSPGQKVRIYLQSDSMHSIPGHVLRLATKGTKPTGRDVVTFETLVIVDVDDPRIKPGMTANVEIEVDRRDNALTVPVEAVVHRKRRDLSDELCKQFDEKYAAQTSVKSRRAAEYMKVVFRIVDDVAVPVLVETGISDPTSVEIVAGLSAQDYIVTGPFRSLDQLKDGSKIEMEEDQKKGGEKNTLPQQGDSVVKVETQHVQANNR